MLLAPTDRQKERARSPGNYGTVDVTTETITPHHYLAFLGVAPELQGHGIGSGLLNHHHARLDAQGLPAYLEASTERSRDLYLRHGYTLTGDAPLVLPDNGPPIWPMWREPAGSS
jgi:predicted N-acetyltransferase YhbS